METSPDDERAPDGLSRQATIDALCEHFANDVMDVEEFERRVGAAHAAATASELKELLRDLPGGGELPAVVDGSLPAPRRSVLSPAEVRETEYIVTVLGGGGRSGRWQPARKNYAVALCGGSELDFREAVMPPGVTELQVFAMWGGVEVIVPPELNVECHGIALMGGFEHKADSLEPPDPSAPTLRVTGVSLMAGVEITVRHPGESARDARRRRKLLRREQRRRLRGR